MPLLILIILLVPLETHWIGSNVFFGFSVIKWVGAFTLIAAFIENGRNRRSPMLVRSWQGRYFILLLFCVLIQFFLSQGLVLTQPIQVYMSFALFFIVILSFVNTAERMRLVVWAIVICMLIASQDSIRQYFVATRQHAHWRVSGTFKGINYFAQSLIVAIPFAYYLLKTVKQEFLKIMLYGTLCMYIVSLMLTSSRGGIVGLGAMFLTVLIIAKKKSKALVVVIFLVVIGYQMAPDQLVRRFEQTKIVTDEKVQGAAASATHRWNLIKAGIRMVEDHPITGVGMGRFKALSSYYAPELGKKFIAHNTYLSIAAEMGLPALFFFLGIIFYTYRSLWRLRRILKNDPKYALLPSAMIVSLSGFVVAALFLTADHIKLFWLLVFLTIAFERIVKEQAQRENQYAIDVEAHSMDGAGGLGDSSEDGSASTGATAVDTKALSADTQEGCSGGQG
jgi:O-antigen ligase